VPIEQSQVLDRAHHPQPPGIQHRGREHASAGGSDWPDFDMTIEAALR
jgi:hypothetical protein